MEEVEDTVPLRCALCQRLATEQETKLWSEGVEGDGAREHARDEALLTLSCQDSHEHETVDIEEVKKYIGLCKRGREGGRGREGEWEEGERSGGGSTGMLTYI